MKIPHSYQLFTAQGSRELDERTISKFGIDGFTLMEIAGTRAADFILQQIKPGSHGLFVCGKGNNAGDALVVARLLSEYSIKCTILFISGIKDLSPDCAKNLQLLQNLETPVKILTSIEKFDLSSTYDFIIDGLLGTGLSSDVRSPYSDIINWVNKQSSLVFSMDIPSGLSADSGEILESSVSADYTLAFGTLKQGFFLNDGYERCGEIIFCELPFPSKLKEATIFLIDDDWVDALQSSSIQREHKYDGGVLYIIAGSEGLTGAAILAAKSAWSTGLGGVVLITPKGLLEIYEKNLIQIIKRPIGNKEDVFFKAEHIDSVQAVLSEKSGNLLIGPGLGRHPETIEFVNQLLSGFEGKAVIDADALFAISKNDLLSKPEQAEWVLTPHPGELKNLVEVVDLSSNQRIDAAKNFASTLNCTIVSKGFPTLIAHLERSLMTGYDTRIFSRAGFGDILAGKIAGFWLNERNQELAAVFALLDGKRKADHHILTSENSLEPLDLI
ncbi:MAG: NAD(P)H-hydrate dehydratase [Balneolaceae bacterium]